LLDYSHLQNALPANGAPVSRQRTGRVREMYQEYVLTRSINNWKFWIVSLIDLQALPFTNFSYHQQFGLISEPMLTSFNATVSTANMDELCRTTMLWIDNHCSLMEIRPGKLLIRLQSRSRF